MDDDLSLINDIENEFKKLGTETKKKYPKIKDFIDFSLKTINNIKSIITTSNNNVTQAKKQFENDLQVSIGIIIKPLMVISEQKITKFNLNSVIILKKLIIYNFISEHVFNDIIKILREMYDNSNEDTQLKILETLQSLISLNISKFSEDMIQNILFIFSRIFCYKNSETRNILQFIVNTFLKKIFDLKNNDIIIKLLKNLVYLSEENKKEKKDWFSSPIVSSKCLGLELLSYIIETYQTKLQEENIQKIFHEDIKILIQKLLAVNTDQVMIYLKVSKLIISIINKLDILYELIEELIKFLSKGNQNLWQKIILLECLTELFKNPKFLFGLYKKHNDLYKKMLITFTDITYQTFMVKSKPSGNLGEIVQGVGASMNIPLLRRQSEALNKIPNKKYLTNNLINNDEVIVITQNMVYVHKLITECFTNLRNSFVILLEQNNINVNVNMLDQMKREQKNKKTNQTFNDTQKDLQEMIRTEYVNIKGGIIGMFINFNDISICQSLISIIQTFIYIFSSFDLVSSRDELLDDLCKLAIPNNLENIFEMKEKNILIIRSIFNLIHCINLLDYSSWIILIETIQNLYYILIKSSSYLYTYREQFNINIILNNLVNIISKYSYKTDITEIEKLIQENDNNPKNISTQNFPEINIPNKDNKNKIKSSININSSNKETMSEENRENVEILSNVVNTLFIESNDYDDDTLLIIIKALYDNTKKIFEDYIKEKKENKKIDSFSNLNGEVNKLRISSISGPNMKEGQLMNINSEVSSPPPEKITNNNNNNNRFQLNGILSAAQAKILNNLNYALSLGNNTQNENIKTGSIGNMPSNTGVVNNNANSNILIQNEKLIANLTYINFNLVKILGLTIININRIHLFWNIIIDTVNLLSSNSVNNRFSNTLSKFTIEILMQIIITILTQYKFKQLENESNKQFNKKEIQITIFKPIFTFLNRHHNLSFVLEPLQKLLEKCSLKLNALGWKSFINILNQILSNGKVDPQQCEIVFKMVEQIFNEYSDYLNIFNIEEILNILEIFSVSQDNNNICYSSISYFWQCAKICEDYQKGKKEMNEEQLALFDKINVSSNEDKNKFIGKIWKDIFLKLININNDERFDIRKSGINVFTQIYVAKIKQMDILFDIEKNRKISADIIYEVFFEILNKNFKNYSNSVKNPKSQEFKDCEDTIVLNLQAIGKAIKCFIEVNNDNFEENNKIYLVYSNKCLDIMKFNTPLISMNILKNLTDLELSNDKLYTENLSNNWKILESISNFIQDEKLFLENYSKTVDGEKLIEVLVDTLKPIYIKLLSMNLNDDILDNEIKKLIEYIPIIFKTLSYTEESFIKANPQVLLSTEKDIFNIIEELGKKIKGNTLLFVVKFLSSYILFDYENPHTEMICRKGIESIGIIFSNANIHLISHEEILKIIPNLINLISPIIKCRIKNEIIEYFIKNKKEGEKILWNYLIDKLLNEIFDQIIFDIKEPLIIDKLIIFFNEFLDDNKNLAQNINTQYINELMNIYQEMEISIVKYIIDELYIKAFFLDKIFQEKIFSLIEIDSPNNKNCTTFSIHKLSIDSLFNLCKFKSKDEIINKLKELAKITTKNIEENKIYDEYLQIKTNIAKNAMPLLLKNCEEEIKNYLKIDQNKKNLLKKRIIYILTSLKDLDFIYDDKCYKEFDNPIMKECLKTKKGHLFMMHLLFGELISVQDNEISNIIKEIFKTISQEMGIKSDK